MLGNPELEASSEIKKMVWKIAPIVATTDQLQLGSLAFMAKFVNPHSLNGDKKEIETVLACIGAEHIGLRERNQLLAHMSENNFFHNSILTNTRKEILQHLKKKDEFLKIPFITTFCVKNLKVEESNKKILKNLNVHAVVNHRNVLYTDSNYTEFGLIGIVKEDFKGKRISDGKYKSLRLMVNDTIRTLGLMHG